MCDQPRGCSNAPMTQLKHVTYANVTATLALALALGMGTSYAAEQVVKLPKNSVGAKQIKANAVGNSEMKDNAITSAEILDGSVTPADVTDGSVTSRRRRRQQPHRHRHRQRLGRAPTSPTARWSAPTSPTARSGTDVTDSSLTGTDVANGSLTSRTSAAGTIPRIFARVDLHEREPHSSPPPARVSRVTPRPDGTRFRRPQPSPQCDGQTAPVTASAVSNAGTQIVRRSLNFAGTTIQFALKDDAWAAIRSNSRRDRRSADPRPRAPRCTSASLSPPAGTARRPAPAGAGRRRAAGRAWRRCAGCASRRRPR